MDSIDFDDAADCEVQTASPRRLLPSVPSSPSPSRTHFQSMRIFPPRSRRSNDKPNAHTSESGKKKKIHKKKKKTRARGRSKQNIPKMGIHTRHHKTRHPIGRNLNTRNFRKKVLVEERELDRLNDSVKKLEERLRHSRADTEFYRRKYKQECSETKALKQELENRKKIDMNSRAGMFEKLFQEERDFSRGLNIKLIDSLKSRV